MSTTFPTDVGDGRQLWGPQVDGTYLISDGGGWIPGVFASREAAMRAFDVDPGELYRLQQAVNARENDPAHRIITLDMLAAT